MGEMEWMSSLESTKWEQSEMNPESMLVSVVASGRDIYLGYECRWMCQVATRTMESNLR